MLNTPLRDGPPSFFTMLRSFSLGDLWFPLLTLIFTFVLFAVTIGSSKISIIKKEPLVLAITTSISNGADLSVIRHLYKQRKIERSSLLLALFTRTQEAHRSDDYYASDTPLSDILQDIWAQQFLNKEQAGSKILPQLDGLIKEHNQANPFDKLEPGQRETFENIRTKLSTNYDAVQIDIARVSDQLHTKNVAVDKYLRDSTFNLWLSIFALFMSLVISAYQIFQSRESRLRALFQQVTRNPS